MIVDVLAYPLFETDPEWLGAFHLNDLSVTCYPDGTRKLQTSRFLVAWRDSAGFWNVPDSRESYAEVFVVRG